MATNRVVKPTLHRYSIVDVATGNRENIKDVIFTFRHNGLIELITISDDCLIYEQDKITIEKY